MYRHLRSGFSSVHVMMFIFGFSMIGITMLSLSSTFSRNSRRTTEKVQANALAESGAQALYDQIRENMLASESYPFLLLPTPVEEVEGTDVVTVGTYSAKVLNVREVLTDSDQGDQKIRNSHYTFFIEGTGLTTSGIQSIVRVKFEADMAHRLIPKSQATSNGGDSNAFQFPVGALVADSIIKIKTEGRFRTNSPDGLMGHVLSNDTVVWETKTKAKNLVTDRSLMKLEGEFLVPSGAAYDRTVGAAGIGNTVPVIKNYSTPALPAVGTFLGVAADEVVKLNSAVTFADAAKAAIWRSNWVASATRVGSVQITGDANTDAMPVDASGAVVLQTPISITGRLRVKSGTKVKLMPMSTNPKDNIVFVAGGVKNDGTISNLGVTLVTDGQYEDSSNSVYQVENAGSPFITREKALMRSNLISTMKDKQAIRIKSGVPATIGLVYATQGGIEVTGNDPVLNGLLVSGGVGNYGGILIEPGGTGTFTLNYEPYAATGGPLEVDSASVIDTEWIPDGLWSAFDPGRPYNWVFMK